MVSATRDTDSQAMIIRPRLGTGWETTIDDLAREIRLRLRILGLALPIGKSIPFSEVAHVAVVCRESWWSRAGEPWDNAQISLMFGIGSVNQSRKPTPMPTKGWRYDLLVTRKGGHTTRLEVLRSSKAADELVGQLRRRIGLSSVN